MPKCNCDGAMDVSDLEDGIVIVHGEDGMHSLEIGSKDGCLYVHPLMRGNDFANEPMHHIGKPISFSALIKECPGCAK